jgi:hypothetical protein
MDDNDSNTCSTDDTDDGNSSPACNDDQAGSAPSSDDNSDLSGTGTPLAAPDTAEGGPHAVCDMPKEAQQERSYGTFDVYPDDFVGPLPAPNYEAGGWPVHQAEMDNIDMTMDAIEGGNSSIRINGDDAFHQHTERDLTYLMTTPTGRDLVETEAAGDKHVTIVPTDGSNFEKGASSQGDLRRDGTPGAGTDSTIQYNPQLTTIGDGSEDWMHRPAAVGLGHEMVHAYADATGTTPVGRTDGIRNEELQAIGLPPYSEDRFSEDRIRAEASLPERTR